MLARLHYRCSSFETMQFFFSTYNYADSDQSFHLSSLWPIRWLDSAFWQSLSALFRILRHKSAFLEVIEYQIMLSVDDYDQKQMLCTMNEWSKLDTNLTDSGFLHLLGERGMPMRQDKTKTSEVHTTSIFSQDQSFHLYFICILAIIFVLTLYLIWESAPLFLLLWSFCFVNCPLLNFPIFKITWSLWFMRQSDAQAPQITKLKSLLDNGFPCDT